jgi:hypothetical protein
MIHSPSNKFELLILSDLPVSFIVVDELQVVYETVNHTNPQQFTSALACYDDAYLAQQFIKYFKILSEKAYIAQIIQTAEPKTLSSNRTRSSTSTHSGNGNDNDNGKNY